MTSALVLGGAGFIGSNICRHLAAAGFKVVAIDGLLPKTSGDVANLASATGEIELVAKRVEDLPSLSDFLSGQDVIVDAMGWSRHWEAFDDPQHDLALNLASHLAVIRALPESQPRRVIYLGSAHQYGRVTDRPITEAQPFRPLDIQSIHKAAAEQHYRIAAERNELSVISLRFGNTFGPAQPLTGEDIGLIGDMIRRALAGETIKVFGNKRVRTVHFAPDLAKIVARLIGFESAGFVPINVPGEHVAIADLAKQISLCTGCAVSTEALPGDVGAIDIGNAPLDCTFFETHFGPPQLTPLAEAIAVSVESARQRLGR